MNAAGRAALAEVRSWPHSILFWWLLVLAPLLGGVTLTGLFGDGLTRRLPVVVCDLDQSSLSRRLIRHLNALPSMRVALTVHAPDEGYARLRKGRAYALLIVPHRFEEYVLHHRALRFIAYVDGQHMPAGSVLRRELTELGTAFWGEAYAALEVRAGIPHEQAQGGMTAPALDGRSPGNPALSYSTFLPHAFVPVLVQLAMVIYLVCILHRQRGKAQTSAGGLCGTLLPGTLWAWLVCCAGAALLRHCGGWEMHGPFAALCGLYLAFTTVCAALAAFIAAMGDDLLESLMLVSGMTSPAFAFSGLSFPLSAMPFGGRLWAGLLPSTQLMKLETSIVIMGAPATSQTPTFVALALQICAFGGMGFLFAKLRDRAAGLMAEMTA